jgi:hypothetical protein
MPVQVKTEGELTLPSLSPSVPRAQSLRPSAYSDDWNEDLVITLSEFQKHPDIQSADVAFRSFWTALASHAGSWPTLSKELVHREGTFHFRITAKTVWGTTRTAQSHGSDAAVADKLLSRALTHDTEHIWRTAQACVEQENSPEELQQRLDEFFGRHGDNGVRALSAVILGRVPSSEPAWLLLRRIAEANSPETIAARRDLLAAALENRDAGLRYEAASALGELGDDVSLNSLRRRLRWEKNDSVRRLIKAELQG